MFLESGEEELSRGSHSPAISRKPRLSRLVSIVYEHHHRREAPAANEGQSHQSRSSSQELRRPVDNGYTLYALYFLSINYILGVGVVGVPYAFSKSGWLLGSALVIVITLISYMTVMWVAEAGERAEIIKEQQQLRATIVKHNNTGPTRTNNILTVTPTTTTTNNVQQFSTNEHTPLLIYHSNNNSSLLLDIGCTENFEVTDLVKLFLGPIHYNLYQISLLALMFIGLLAYTQVFCVTVRALLFASEKDDTAVGLFLPLLVFSAIVIPLSCIELEEQIYMQAILSLMRFVVIFAMILGSAVGLFLSHKNISSNGDLANNSKHFPAPIVNFSGFGVAFSTALFSQLFQHSVPGLIRPLLKRPQSTRKRIRVVFGASLLTTCSLYLLLGITTSSYFLQDTNPSVNLNFVGYANGLNPTKPWVKRICIALNNYIVVLFPALDTLSVFPLVAITLGNNLFAASSPRIVNILSNRLLFFTPSNYKQHTTINSTYYDSVENPINSTTRMRVKVATIFFRLCAAVPPLIGSLFATDLSFSLQLAGVAGVYVAFVAPSLLQSNSTKLVEALFGTTSTTIYSGWYSRSSLPAFVLCFAAFSFVIVCIQIREYLIQK